jgi:hypothetical protein
MIYVAIGATFAALGLFGLADQYRRGDAALLETIVLSAVAVGVGLGLIGAGVS